MDALHAQHDTARAVLDRRADYVMTVKANIPTLYGWPLRLLRERCDADHPAGLDRRAVQLYQNYYLGN